MFSVSDFVNDAVDGALRAPIAYTIASSPIYTAIVITFVVVIIALLCLGRGPARAIVKTLIWVFTAVVILMLLHDKILLGDGRRGGDEEFINNSPMGIVDSAAADKTVPAGTMPVAVSQFHDVAEWTIPPAS
jgi:hypothetical protein